MFNQKCWIFFSLRTIYIYSRLESIIEIKEFQLYFYYPLSYKYQYVQRKLADMEESNYISLPDNICESVQRSCDLILK